MPPDPGAARRARRLVREVLEAAGRPEWVDAAELAVSELVTDAALHARTPVEVGVEVHRQHARVQVRDSSPALPAQHHYGEQVTTGRGMALVAAVSSECGTTSLPDGKVVWFELRALDEEPGEEELLAAWDEDRWGEPEGTPGAPGPPGPRPRRPGAARRPPPTPPPGCRWRLLALPGQAEVVAVRDRVCEEVQSQLHGGPPRAWQVAVDAGSRIVAVGGDGGASTDGAGAPAAP
nr:ATP-binding protein [Kineococcus vitellinus]